MRPALYSQALFIVLMLAFSACKEEKPKKEQDDDYNQGLYNQDYSSPSQTGGLGYDQYGSQGAGGSSCSYYSDQLSCQSSGTCLWNAGLNACTDNTGTLGPTGMGNPCASIIDQNQCNQAQVQGCSWGIDYITNQVRCGHSCEQNTNQSACMNAAAQGCQWGPVQLGGNLFRCLPAGSFPQQGLGTGYYPQPGYQPGYQPGIF